MLLVGCNCAPIHILSGSEEKNQQLSISPWSRRPCHNSIFMSVALILSWTLKMVTSSIAAPHSKCWEHWKHQPSMPTLQATGNHAFCHTAHRCGASVTLPHLAVQIDGWQLYYATACELQCGTGALKRRGFSALILLTIFTDSSSTHFRHSAIFFTASCSLWMQQCVAAADGATARMRATSPFSFPVIAVAPSVQMPTHLDQSGVFVIMKSLSEWKSASPVVLVGRERQKRKSSCTPPA